MKIFILLTTLAISFLMASDYNIDKSHTKVGFKVKQMMLTNIRGNFSDFHGNYSIDDKLNQLVFLKAKVKIASLSTNNEKRDAHLVSDAFFDANHYKYMTIKLLKHIGNIVIVNLTIKDITKEIKMDIKALTLKTKDSYGNIRTSFALSTKIDRQDFKIKFNKLLDIGGVLVSNDVKILIKVEGILVN